MKVLLVGYTIPDSGVRGMGLGISRYIYYLGKELRKMRHDVQLVVRDDFKPREKWISTAKSPKFGWYPYPLFLRGALKKMEADVYNADYVVTGVPLAGLNKKPLVVAVHDGLVFHPEYQRGISFKDKMFVNFFKHSFNQVKDKASALVMRSENAKEDLLEHVKVDEDKVFVVAGGIDPEYFFPVKRPANYKIKIGYKGGLDGRKNAELLVEVFKKIAKDRDDIELHVAGGGKNLQRFREMNIPNAKFYGFIPMSKENEFLNSLDIYVYPTLGEGLGLGPLEAMACKVPVLASNTTSMPEVVGTGGVMTEPTVGAFYEELMKLVEDEALRKKLAAKGYRRSKNMTWKRTAEDSLKVYKTVV